MLRKFTIEEQYITEVSVTRSYDHVKDRNNPTYDELIKVLQGHDRSYSYCTDDHDEFKKLRNNLEELGYIRCERSWWNGDVVLKSFKLNEWTFRKGQKFPCAAAINSAIASARTYNQKFLCV